MTIVIRRRQFISALVGAIVTWPLAARAQQAGKLLTIGFLGASTSATESQRVAAFVEQLRALGWTEGSNLAIAYRWAEGRNDRASEIAAEFVRLKVDVIVTEGTPEALSAKQATSVIPIVFTTVTDPVSSGLVANLARPGGNVTGLSLQQNDLAGKRIELLRDVVPGLARLAMLANVGNPANELEIGEVKAASGTLGLDLAMLEVRRAEDIAPAFERFKGRADALYVTGDPLITASRVRINTLVLIARLPTMYSTRDYVQPTKFDLVINQTTTKALGLKIPESLLSLADEVIE